MRRRIMNQIVKVFLLVGIGFSIIGASNAQTFETIEFTQRTKGVVDWHTPDEVVLYGTGLIWMNHSGKITDELRIIPGLPSSDIIDACPSLDGGIFVLTEKGLGHVNQAKEGSTIFTKDDYPKADFEEIEIGNDGKVYCLRKNGIIEILPDNTHRSVYASEKRDKYFKHFTIDDKGNFYVASYKVVHKIDPNGNHSQYEFEKNVSLQDISWTSDGKVIVLEYRDIYELKDGKLELFIAGRQFSYGIKFYEAHFDSSTDFWLYSSEGNAFHNDDGQWKNYTPPAGLKTGNFGEHLLKSKNGDIWMTLAGYTVMRFDGKNWSKFNIDKDRKQVIITRAELKQGLKQITKDSKTFELYEFIDGEMSLIPEAPAIQYSQFEYDEAGNIYFKDKTGIYQIAKGNQKKIVDVKDIKDYVVMKDQIVYGADKKVFVYKNGTTESIEENKHFLGWDDVSNPKLALMHDGRMIAYAKYGVFSIYDGNTWKKVTSVDGKKIGGITSVIALKDKTIIGLKKGRVLQLIGDKITFLHQPEDLFNAPDYRYYGSPDGSIWMMEKDQKMLVIRENSIHEFKLPIDGKFTSISAVVPIEPDIYDIYLRNTTLRCKF